MLDKHPMVIIFGAGASRGIGNEPLYFVPPPVDMDFFDTANKLHGHGTPSVLKNVLRTVWELYARTSGISLERYYRDIETRYAISRFARSGNKPKDWHKRQADLEELIRRVLIHTTCEPDSKPMKPLKSKDHADIFKKLKKRDTLITFNYDLVIEESFEDGKLWNPTDGYGAKAQGKSFDWCRKWMENRGRDYKGESESKIHLLKLHGSINWTLYRNKEISLKKRPYLVRTKKFERISILPPGWNKRIDRNPYKKFWSEARQAMEKCKTLVIIGFSLPETDLLTHALFAEIVRMRATRKDLLKELHIADPDQRIKDKFIAMFNPALGPSGKVFTYENLRDFSKSVGATPLSKRTGIQKP